MTRSEEIKSIGAALAKAQGQFGKVVKGKTAQITANQKYAYADLAAVCEAIIPTLAAHGIAVVQGSPAGDPATMETMLVHGESGEWISTYAPIYEGRNGGAQGWGSGVTYARRYALLAAVGVAPEDDDDGANASGSVRRPGAAAAVTAEQYTVLRDLIEETDSDEAAFLRAFGASGDLQQFPAAKFGPAKAALEKKRQKA